MARKNPSAAASVTKDKRDPIILELEGLIGDDGRGEGWTAKEYAEKAGICVSAARRRINILMTDGSVEYVGKRKTDDVMGRPVGTAPCFRVVK